MNIDLPLPEVLTPEQVSANIPTQEVDLGSTKISRKYGVLNNTVKVTDSYTAKTNDYLILVNQTTGTKTITLPIVANGKEYIIKALTANAVTVDGGDYNIDGAATKSLASQYAFIKVIFCEGSWHTIAQP